ncbi:MAG: hypothetical protein WCI04_01410 [archaeon]
MVFGLFEKGKIDLITPKVQYAHGEEISGTINIKLNKPIMARGIFVTIFAETTSTRMGSRGIEKYTTRTFEFSIPIDKEKEYGIMPLTYEFKLGVPALQQAKTPDGVMGAAVQAISFLAAGVGNTKWFLEAKLDIPKGFDVSKKIQINVV